MVTQEVLFKKGAADDQWCKLCGKRGSPHHRLHGCQALQGERDKCPRFWQHIARTAGEGSLLWTRALTQDPCSSMVFRKREATHFVDTAAGEEDSDVTGLVALDGSLSHWHPAGGNMGWCVAVCGPEGEKKARHWGTAPADFAIQCKPLRAELWAFYMFVRLLVPPARALVDCASVILGLRQGQLWCEAGARPHADIWRKIWRQIGETGPESVGNWFVTKVKAHRSKLAISKLDAQGKADALANDLADIGAKDGAYDALEQARAQTWADACEKVKGSLSYMACFLPMVKEGKGWRDADLPRYLPGFGKVSLADFPRHVLTQCSASGLVECVVCRRVAKTQATAFRMSMSACLQRSWRLTAADVQGRWAVVRGHRLMQTSGYSWCDRCGAHSWFRRHLLAKQCRGKPGYEAQGARLNYLRAGGTPYGVWIGAPRRLTTLEVAGLEKAADVGA